MTQKAPIGQRGGQHPLARFVNKRETYGEDVINKFVSSIPRISNVVDLGAGRGRDLSIVRRIHPDVKTIAIEGSQTYAKDLVEKVDEIHILNLEKSELPFGRESIDLIIANQVLEHMKEVFWVFHQVASSLKVGGHFLIGVPNIASFHNRLLLLGKHPTQHKLCSAHVRPFSREDTCLFFEECFPKGFELIAFAGSQFYPFPKIPSRILSSLFPNAAFSIFFLMKKIKTYNDEFILYPARASLETNFWCGGSENPLFVPEASTTDLSGFSNDHG